MEEKPRCCGRVPGEGKWGSFHMTQCKKNATVERDGKHYCKTHDPVARKERQDKSYEACRDKIKRQVAREDFKSRAASLCEGVSVEKLKELGEGWLAHHLEGK